MAEHVNTQLLINRNYSLRSPEQTAAVSACPHQMASSVRKALALHGTFELQWLRVTMQQTFRFCCRPSLLAWWRAVPHYGLNHAQ